MCVYTYIYISQRERDPVECRASECLVCSTELYLIYILTPVVTHLHRTRLLDHF